MIVRLLSLGSREGFALWPHVSLQGLLTPRHQPEWMTTTNIGTAVPFGWITLSLGIEGKLETGFNASIAIRSFVIICR